MKLAIWFVIAATALAARASTDDPANTGLTSIVPSSKFESLAQRLASVSVSPADRRAVAQSLISEIDAQVVAPQQLETIASILRNQRGSFAQSAMLWALANAPSLPEQLLPHLSWLLPTANPEDLASTLQAIGNIRTRAAAKILIDTAGTKDLLPPGVRPAAFAGLVRLSGRIDLASDLPKWTSWLADAQAMDQPTWQRELTRGQAARAALAGNTEAALRLKLLDALRDLHVATMPDKRDDLLSQLLTDPDPAIITLGFELVRREMSEGTAIGSKATDAVLQLLKSDRETTRINTALLISQLAPSNAGHRLAEAISHEESLHVVTALLVAALAYADTLPPPILVHWLMLPGPHTDAAVDLGFAMLRAGKLEAPVDRQQLLLVARSLLQARNPSWSACHVLGILGDDADFVTLVKLLQTDSRDGQLAAADALSGYPEFVDPIVAAARTDPDLFEIAARVFVLHRSDLAGFKSLAALPSPDAESRRRNLLFLAALCPAADVLAAAKSLNAEPLFLEGLLSSLTSENRILSERTDPRQLKAIADGIVWLARIRLDLHKPDSAIAAINSLPEIEEVVTDLHMLTRTRVEAWVCLDRVDEALKLDSVFDDWLAALARCPLTNQTAELVSLLETRFNLTPQQKETLAKVLTPPPVP